MTTESTETSELIFFSGPETKWECKEVVKSASGEKQKEIEDKVTNPEKIEEEAKLNMRYPQLERKSGGSGFLWKLLQNENIWILGIII